MFPEAGKSMIGSACDCLEYPRRIEYDAFASTRGAIRRPDLRPATEKSGHDDSDGDRNGNGNDIDNVYAAGFTRPPRSR